MVLKDIRLKSREEGIRTLDTLERYTHFPGVLLRPLGHLSRNRAQRYAPRQPISNSIAHQVYADASFYRKHVQLSTKLL